ncbi:MAG: tyrosine-type recombinase/integrase [Desulfovibrio sp.]|uniref:tyrosine-type recombinase/integrase n=1 Tax=Desulfovibrio sp. TaxID=885 RepID=UPI0039E2FAB3
MSVSQRADGRFIVKYRADGHWKQRSFKIEQEAIAFDLEQSQPHDNEDITMGELLMVFVRSRPDLHRTTKNSLAWLFSDDGPCAFMRDKYAEALNRRDLEMLREGMRARDVTNNTINHYQAYIQSVLAWGVEQELIQRHPWQFKKLKVVKPIVTADLPSLLMVYRQLPEYMQWAVKTAFFLALRFGHVELFSLQWSAFDWQRRQVVIRQGKSGKLKTVLIRNQAYYEEAMGRFAQDMRNGVPLVCHRHGMRVLAYRTAWLLACRRAGVKMKPYAVRHVAATTMLANGADLAAVAAQLGHSSVATTGSTYAHVTPLGQAHAAESMPTLDAGDGKK